MVTQILRSGEPFCDFLSVSFPIDSHVIDAILDKLFAPIHTKLRSPDLWEVGPYQGTVKKINRSGSTLTVLSFSGTALRAIREANLFQEMCEMIHDVPYRVTRLDASCDFICDAPAQISKFNRRVRRGSIVLGKKVVRSKDMTTFIAENADGKRTGTIYLGGPKAEIRACIYDKQFERVKKGFPDPGPLLRVEIRLRSQVGCTVWDGLFPDRVFYHYAAPDLVEPPTPLRSWEPNGVGFSMPVLQSKFTPKQRLIWMVDEAPIIKKMLALATMPDGAGLEYLFSLLRMKSDGRQRQIYRELFMDR